MVSIQAITKDVKALQNNTKVRVVLIQLKPRINREPLLIVDHMITFDPTEAISPSGKLRAYVINALGDHVKAADEFEVHAIQESNPDEDGAFERQ